MSVGAGAVYLTDTAALQFIHSTIAKSSGQQALPATVRGLSCHVDSERERREEGREVRKEVKRMEEENQ